jgi:hypothetical protein
VRYCPAPEMVPVTESELPHTLWTTFCGSSAQRRITDVEATPSLRNDSGFRRCAGFLGDSPHGITWVWTYA